MDYALPFDKVKPADHQNVGLMSAELKTGLKARSADRVQASKDFTKLNQDIERLKTVLKRKTLPLSEPELKEQMKREDAEKSEQEKNGLPPELKVDDPVYKFPRNFVSTEILNIMGDLIRERKLVLRQP